nr:MAG: hypothetical protein [Plasmopara viticola lesion associated narnavirus 4]
MSGNVRTRAGGGNSTNTTSASAPVFRAKAKPKVSPVTGGNFDFSGDPRIGESFVVVMAGPDRVKTITFHHPIGCTELDDDVWVATPTGDIPDLVARRDDPYEAAIREKRENHRFNSALAAGLVTKGDDGVARYPSGIERQATLAAARAAAKVAAKGAGNKPAPMAYLAHLSAERRVEEDAIRGHLSSKAVILASEEAFPDSKYRTKSGPLADRVQKAQKYLEGLSRAQAEDTVVKQIFD